LLLVIRHNLLLLCCNVLPFVFGFFTIIGYFFAPLMIYFDTVLNKQKQYLVLFSKYLNYYLKGLQIYLYLQIYTVHCTFLLILQ